MPTLKITAKGQITLRRDILEHLRVGPGAQVDVEKLPGGRVEIRTAPAGEIAAVFGMLKKKGGPTLSVEQMNETARRGWAGK